MKTSKEKFVELDGKINLVIQKLDLCKQYLSKKVTGLVNLKFSPKLVFKNDRSLFELNKIEKILKSEKVQKDLKSD